MIPRRACALRVTLGLVEAGRRPARRDERGG
jgi:hypothetical protein